MKKILTITLLFSSFCAAMEVIPAVQTQADPLSKEINHLLDEGFDPKASFALGNTLLHAATDIPTAKRLIEAGTPINSQNDVGWTPLITATIYGNTELCSYLIDQGADVNLTTHSLTPGYTKKLDQAIKKLENLKGLKNLLMLWYNFYASDTYPHEAAALHYAARQGYDDICISLVKKGSRINMPSKGGTRNMHGKAYPRSKADHCPLMIAANYYNQSYEAFSTLLSLGVCRGM